MKTIFAVQKSEYSHNLIKYIHGKCSDQERKEAYFRMLEIEQEVKDLGDEIQIVITTKNTSNQYVAPAMTEENIDKNKHYCKCCNSMVIDGHIPDDIPQKNLWQ